MDFARQTIKQSPDANAPGGRSPWVRRLQARDYDLQVDWTLTQETDGTDETGAGNDVENNWVGIAPSPVEMARGDRSLVEIAGCR